MWQAGGQNGYLGLSDRVVDDINIGIDCDDDDGDDGDDVSGSEGILCCCTRNSRFLAFISATRKTYKNLQNHLSRPRLSYFQYVSSLLNAAFRVYWFLKAFYLFSIGAKKKS